MTSWTTWTGPTVRTILESCVHSRTRATIASPLRSPIGEARFVDLDRQGLHLTLGVRHAQRVSVGDTVIGVFERAGRFVSFFSHVTGRGPEDAVLLDEPDLLVDLGRRRTPRIPVDDSLIRVWLVHEGQVAQGAVTDISAGGIGVRIDPDQMVPPEGAMVLARMERADGVLAVIGSVVNARPPRCGVQIMNAYLVTDALRDFANRYVLEWLGQQVGAPG